MSLFPKLFLLLPLFAAHAAHAEPPLLLLPGWPTQLAPARVSGFTIQDPAVATAQLSKEGALLVTGLKEGSTAVQLFAEDGKVSRTVRVRVESAGWDLVPVLVATQDIREQTLLTPQMVTTRLIPRALATSSITRPDALQYLVNQPAQVPLLAGDLVLWGHFEQLKR